MIQAIEILYDNFEFVVYALIFAVIIICVTGYKLARTQLETKVLVLKTTSAQIVKAKEVTGDGVLQFEKKIIKRSSDPHLIKTGLFSWVRLFIWVEGTLKTLNVSKVTLNEALDAQMWSAIVEKNTIEQMVRGLMEELRETLIKLAAGGLLGFVLAYILQAITEG